MNPLRPSHETPPAPTPSAPSSSAPSSSVPSSSAPSSTVPSSSVPAAATAMPWVRRGPKRWQRLLPRWIAVAAVCAFVGAIALRTTQQHRFHAKATRSANSTTPTIHPNTAESTAESTDQGPDQSVAQQAADIAGPAGTQGQYRERNGVENAVASVPATLESAADAGDPTSAPTYRSRMLGAFGALVDQQSEVFGDTDSGVRRELDSGLSVADDILANAREANRRAIREANRQVRWVDRSPALLVILVPGLSREALGCYREVVDAASPSPAIDRLAGDGMRSDGFAFAGRVRMQGSQGESSGERIEPSRAERDDSLTRLPRLLWESGYATSALGDTGPGGASAGDESWWESRFGWSAEMADAPTTQWPFPTSVLTDGRSMRIANNVDRQAPVRGSRPTVDAAKSLPAEGSAASRRSFAEVLLDEASSVTRAASGGSKGMKRPLALVVRTPFAWWQALAARQASSLDKVSGPSESQSSDDAVRELDRFVEQLVAGFRPRRAPSTLIVIAGLPSGGEATGARNTSGLGPLVVHWPNKVPAGLRTVALHGESQLLAAIADFIQSTRRDAAGHGRSPWTGKPSVP